MLCTTQLTGDPEMRPAATRPDTPAPTMLSGSTRAAADGHWNAMIAASTTAPKVHTLSPNSTMPIAATGTSSRPQPKRRSTLPSIRHTNMSIHILLIVALAAPQRQWRGT